MGSRLTKFQDALELSDDSDIEVHPNVDKRSFIRAKQNQIHQQRFERKHKIETFKYERIVNDGLLKRINALLAALQSYSPQSDKRPDELAFQALMESTGEDDSPPPPPEGVHTHEKEAPPTYSKMMAALIDQVKTKVDEDKPEPEKRFDAYLAEIKVHRDKVQDLQSQLLKELDTLEKEESKKITSESIHTGFDSSYVSKSDAKAPEPKKAPAKKEKVQAVEVLNPHALANQDGSKQAEQSSGADADVDDSIEDDDDEGEVEASELGKKFAQIKMGDYRACLQYISANPSVLAERETDGLLVMAFNTAIQGKDDFARQCVHQALLLQYCRALGKDGVGLFFKRITTQGHQAQKVFFDDVNSTFDRIRTRAREIEKQRAAEDGEGGGVEQIQLHAVDPGTSINIKIPPASSEDPAEQQSRAIFDTFPPGLQRALESGSLDEVNKVLGKMSVEEAEEIVGQLSEGGMLSLEEQIIDATTEEGQAALKEFEEHEKQRALAEKYADDPE
ncbi:Hsp90 co-chaperone Cdc37 protein [Rutstroemia sp. NJR-2017a BVV2]|nr:Hsp90 co-chaperone Cdc37 protein [Rutstroemia sp. NJR-2017a BVV2]